MVEEVPLKNPKEDYRSKEVHRCKCRLETLTITLSLSFFQIYCFVLMIIYLN